MTDPATITRLRELTGWRGNSDDDGEHEEDIDLADWQIRAIYSALQSGAIPIPDDAPQLAAQAAEIERLRQQAKDIEKWQKLALVAEDVTNDRIANLLENDTMAKGHSFSDVAAVFMRKANRLQRELNAAEVRMADLERWLEESREALRKIAVHVGGSVGEQCSHQFHLLVEDEVRLVMEKLRGGSNATKREKAVQVLRDCDEYIEVFSYEPEVCLDGWFTTDQVEAIAMGMHDLTIFKDADRL